MFVGLFIFKKHRMGIFFKLFFIFKLNYIRSGRPVISLKLHPVLDDTPLTSYKISAFLPKCFDCKLNSITA